MDIGLEFADETIPRGNPSAPMGWGLNRPFVERGRVVSMRDSIAFAVALEDTRLADEVLDALDREPGVPVEDPDDFCCGLHRKSWWMSCLCPICACGL